MKLTTLILSSVLLLSAGCLPPPPADTSNSQKNELVEKAKNCPGCDFSSANFQDVNLGNANLKENEGVSLITNFYSSSDDLDRF